MKNLLIYFHIPQEKRANIIKIPGSALFHFFLCVICQHISSEKLYWLDSRSIFAIYSDGIPINAKLTVKLMNYRQSSKVPGNLCLLCDIQRYHTIRHQYCIYSFSSCPLIANLYITTCFYNDFISTK